MMELENFSRQTHTRRLNHENTRRSYRRALRLVREASESMSQEEADAVRGQLAASSPP